LEKKKKMKAFNMRKTFIISLLISIALFFTAKSNAQVDLNHIDINDIIGKVMHVKKGFAPKFSLGNTPIQKINKVAEILGLKKNETVNRLFNTFRTGRAIYKVAVYTGSAIALYGLIREAEKSSNHATALYSGLGAAASGVIVKLLTKGAAYKAVDIFNGIAARTIKDIFSIGPASGNAGLGLYVKL
jgi:hypothetical protein